MKLDPEPRLNGVSATVMEWARKVVQVVNGLVDSAASFSASIIALTTALALKANIDSPTFTGTPAAPPPASTDNSTRIATTAWAKFGFVLASGYIKFPAWLGSLLIQWGGVTGGNAVSFPVTFPSGVATVLISPQVAGAAMATYQSLSNSGFFAQTWAPGGGATANFCTWVAIGT